jgi:hypothetical protein
VAVSARTNGGRAREVWRRLVVLTLSVLLLSGLSPAPRDLASFTVHAPQLVAGSAAVHPRAQSTERHLRRHDGTRTTTRDARAGAPPPHVLPAMAAWTIAPALEIVRLPGSELARRAITIGARDVVRARGPPVFA